MKSILAIGMGRFGSNLTRKFIELGNEVMAVDASENKINNVVRYVTNAQIGDCTKQEVLEALGVSNFDVCVVCMGSNFQNSLEITALLKELGAKFVVSRATSDIHAKFLLRNGADEVIYPERDMAERVAVRHSAEEIFDYIELTEDVSICEIALLPQWVGKSIREVEFANKYKVSILAIKTGDDVEPVPSADHVFSKDEHLMILGHQNDLEKLLKMFGKASK